MARFEPSESWKKLQAVAEQAPLSYIIPDWKSDPTGGMMGPIGMALPLSKAKMLRRLAPKIIRGESSIPTELAGAIKADPKMPFKLDTLQGQQNAVNFLRGFEGVKQDKPFADLLHQIDFLIESMKRSK